jgi:hypothetical protein
MREPKYRFIDKELNIPTFNLPKPAPYVYGYMIASADPNRYKILKRVLIWWKPISFETFTREIMELVGYEKALRKKAFQVEMEKAGVIGLKEEEYQTLDNMSAHGGSFVKALSEAFRCADSKNFAKLRKVFPEYWNQYSNFNTKEDGTKRPKGSK